MWGFLCARDVHVIRLEILIPMADNNTEPQVEETETPTEETQERLGEGGLKALEAEREARKNAEKRAKEVQVRLAELEKAEQERKDAELSELERERKRAGELEAQIAERDLRVARAEALAKYPVPDEYQDLVVGSDAESFEASAKKLHDLNAKATGHVAESFDHSMPSSGNVGEKLSDFEAGAAKARAKYNKQ